MDRRFTAVTIGLTAVVAFLVGLIVAGSLIPTPAVSLGRGPDRAAAAPKTGDTPNAATGAANFADIAERLNPSVVNIDATSRARRHPPGPLRPPGDGSDPHDSPQRGAGSGFIIDADGYILTNFHVVDRADRLTVKLSDGRSLRARVVGTDPDTDIALIKVDNPGRVRAAPLGNSDRLRVGEWVCAIGNPLAYEHSVTVGVVSFVGRKLWNASLDNYIQTDAAINFGNSGGPLINTRGEVIGINAAISSRASNIGFAVPISQATSILAQLKATGHVRRGYIGVRLKDLDPDLERSLSLGVAEGALVEDVTAGSPAERAGLRTYDIIQALDDRALKTDEDLIRDVAAREPGSVARLRILRNGRIETLVVKLTERREQSSNGKLAALPAPVAGDRPAVPIGLTVQALDGDATSHRGVPAGMAGVMVSQVDPLSPAFDADIERGYIILEINREKVAGLRDFERITRAARAGDPLTFFVFMPGFNERALRTLRVEGR
jgi:serine protease Do